MFCTWCEGANFTNQMAKGTSVYKKETIDRHLKVKDHSIANIIKQELRREIRNSPFWSIMIDETTSISDEKHLAIVSKHMSHNVPVLRFIGLIELENCTANSILEQMLKFIQVNELNLDNLIHFGSDGASTMVGKLF